MGDQAIAPWRMRKRRRLGRNGRWVYGGDRELLAQLAKRKKYNEAKAAYDAKKSAVAEQGTQESQQKQERQAFRKKEQKLLEEMAEIEEEKEHEIAMWSLDNVLKGWMSRMCKGSGVGGEAVGGAGEPSDGQR